MSDSDEEDQEVRCYGAATTARGDTGWKWMQSACVDKMEVGKWTKG